MKKYSFLIICTLLTGLLFTTCEPWIVPEAVFVNFNANGGQGDMKAQRFEDGEKQALTKNTYTRNGYIFDGWNTRSDGRGQLYADRQNVSITKSVTLYAQWRQKQVISGTENGHDYVDLGLPSGLKWATCNVGATAPEGYGDYFAWGETSPKDNYDWSTYKYCNGSYLTLTKYNTKSDYGTVDNKTTLDLSDDAARANWGGKWRMPTQAEHDELIKNCTWTWTIQDGVKGYKVASRTNGNSIFLPAAGSRYGTSVDFVGSSGGYWSSSLSESDPYNAFLLYFISDYVDWCGSYRDDGHPVRAVCGNNTAAQTFTLTFNANGGTGTMAAQTFEAGVSQAITANTFTRSGYTFTSWNTNADGSGTSYTDKQSITLLQDITLYAQWKKDIVNYTITFNANGGTGTMAAQTFEAGVSQAITANTFTRSGYTFTGWNTKADGSGTSYTDKQSITLSQDITLYAQWEFFTPTYVDLGLSVKWATCNVGATTPEAYGDYFAWGETSPKSNYTWETYKFRTSGDIYTNVKFNKYNTSSDRGTIDNKTTLDLSDDAARANWGGAWRMPTKAEQDELRKNCTWTWTTQSGVNGYSVTSKTNGNSIFLPAAGNRNGTSVGGVGSDGYYWSSSLNESYPYDACYLYFDSGTVGWSSFNRYHGRTVRAVCGNNSAAQTFTISFNANGGSGTMAAQTFEAGVSQAIKANTFTRSGYTFTGWNTKADGSGTSYTDKQSITISQNITLYAQWIQQSAVEVYVSYEANGGYGEMEMQVFKYGEKKALLPCSFVAPSNFVFNGWNTKEDGTGTAYSDQQEIEITIYQDLTLYAQWKKITYSVTFIANGGSGTMPVQIFEIGVSQTLATNKFTRSGYFFIGWNTVPDASGTSYTDGQKITLTENIILYAQWKHSRGKENGHEWVDLGLPSGIKWATCNVGAAAAVGHGDYFAWGETSPKDNYDWSTYKYCNGSEKTLTKYNTTTMYGTVVDNKTTLELSDDAARANWGGNWRMPTAVNLRELLDNCTWTRTTQNGVIGYNVTSKINGESIFLPAAGYKIGTSVEHYGMVGYYWSNRLFNEGSAFTPNAHSLSVADNMHMRTSYRYYGYTVRAVCP